MPQPRATPSHTQTQRDHRAPLYGGGDADDPPHRTGRSQLIRPRCHLELLETGQRRSSPQTHVQGSPPTWTSHKQKQGAGSGVDTWDIAHNAGISRRPQSPAFPRPLHPHWPPAPRHQGAGGGQRKEQRTKAASAAASATAGTHQDTPSSPQVVLTSQGGTRWAKAAHRPTAAPPGGLTEWGCRESGPGRDGGWVPLLGYSELRDLQPPKGRGSESRTRSGSRCSSTCSRPRKERGLLCAPAPNLRCSPRPHRGAAQADPPAWAGLDSWAAARPTVASHRRGRHLFAGCSEAC